MAENKKGFVLYADVYHTVKHLSNDQAGELFKHLLGYVNDENPTSENPIVNIAFEPIKQQLKRDLKKWEGIREKRAEAGRKSAEARKQKATNSTSVKSVEQTSTNSTVNDNVIVNVNDNVTVNDIKEDIIKRENKFRLQLKDYLQEYPADMLKAFFEYWTERGEKDKKMRFEKEKSWSLSRRLKRWSNNNFNKNGNNNNKQPSEKLSRFEKFQKAANELNQSGI